MIKKKWVPSVSLCLWTSVFSWILFLQYTTALATLNFKFCFPLVYKIVWITLHFLSNNLCLPIQPISPYLDSANILGYISRQKFELTSMIFLLLSIVWALQFCHSSTLMPTKKCFVFYGTLKCFLWEHWYAISCSISKE